MKSNRQPEQILGRWWEEIDAGDPPTTTIVAASRRQRRRRRVLATAATAVALLATGGVVNQWAGLVDPSGTTTPEAGEVLPTTGEHPPVVNAEIIRGSSHYDYPGFDDISDAVESANVGFAGVVVEWSEGRSLRDDTDVSLTAVLTIKVTDSFKVPSLLAGGRIHVEVPRGGYVVDENGEEVRHPGARPAYRGIGEISDAIPPGVRVIVLGDVAPSDDALAAATPGSKVLGAGAGHPQGTSLVSPYPQGLLFETHTRGVASGMDHGGPVDWGWMPQSSKVTFEDLLVQART